MGMLIWVWGRSDEPRDAHHLPLPGPFSGALIMAPAATPAVVTVEFEGAVAAVTDPSLYLGGNVGVGDTVSGRFAYDPSAPDGHPQPDMGRYRLRESPCGVEAETVRLRFASDPAAVDIRINLLNDKQASVLKDQYEVKSASNVDVLPGVGVGSIDILLVDETATALTSDALANQPPDAATWIPTRTLTITGLDGWIVEASIELVAPVDPIPRRRAKVEFQEM
jgi:hypothetical protein